MSIRDRIRQRYATLITALFAFRLDRCFALYMQIHLDADGRYIMVRIEG